MRLSCAYAATWALGSTRSPRPNRPQRHRCSRPAHSSPLPEQCCENYPAIIYTSSSSSWPRPSPPLCLAPHLTLSTLGPHAAGCKDGLCLELQYRQDICTVRASRPLWTLSFSPSCWISALSGRYAAIMTCHRVSNSGVIYSVLAIDSYRASAPAL